jgi:hypothetical protein
LSHTKCFCRRVAEVNEGEGERLALIEEKLSLLVRLREELHFEKRYAEVLSRT